METLNSQVIEMLRKECIGATRVSAYMKHVIIELDDVFPKQVMQQKEKIAALIGKHFPERNDDLPLTIRSNDGYKDEDVLIRRTSKA